VLPKILTRDCGIQWKTVLLRLGALPSLLILQEGCAGCLASRRGLRQSSTRQRLL